MVTMIITIKLFIAQNFPLNWWLHHPTGGLPGVLSHGLPTAPRTATAWVTAWSLRPWMCCPRPPLPRRRGALGRWMELKGDERWGGFGCFWNVQLDGVLGKLWKIIYLFFWSLDVFGRVLMNQTTEYDRILWMQSWHSCWPSLKQHPLQAKSTASRTWTKSSKSGKSQPEKRPHWLYFLGKQLLNWIVFLFGTCTGKQHFCWGKSWWFPEKTRHQAPLQRLPRRLETQGSRSLHIASKNQQVIWIERSLTSTNMLSDDFGALGWGI